MPPDAVAVALRVDVEAEAAEAERPVLRYHVTDDRLEGIAREVLALPDHLTMGQRSAARIIAQELLRKGR